MEDEGRPREESESDLSMKSTRTGGAGAPPPASLHRKEGLRGCSRVWPKLEAGAAAGSTTHGAGRHKDTPKTRGQETERERRRTSGHSHRLNADDRNAEEGHEVWKAPELKRIKKGGEDQEARAKENAETEHTRNLTEGERQMVES